MFSVKEKLIFLNDKKKVNSSKTIFFCLVEEVRFRKERNSCCIKPL